MSSPPLSVPGYEIDDRDRSGRLRGRRVADRLEVELTVLRCQNRPASAVIRDVSWLARIRHEHLVRVYDVVPIGPAGSAARGPWSGPARRNLRGSAVSRGWGGSALAIATEPVDGPTLAEVLDRVGRLSPGQAATAVAPIAAALGALHAAGVVHGALTLDSIRFDRRGRPVLTDTVIAHQQRVAVPVPEPPTQDLGDQVHNAAEDGAVDGWSDAGGGREGADRLPTPPEIREGLPPNPDTDVFAVGAVLRCCLGWSRDGANGAAPPAEWGELVGLVEESCAEEPSERPTPEGFAQRLLEMVRTAPVPIRPAVEGAHPALPVRPPQGAPDDATDGPHPGVQGSERRTKRRPKHRSRPWYLRAERERSGRRRIRLITVLILAAILGVGVAEAVVRVRGEGPVSVGRALSVAAPRLDQRTAQLPAQPPSGESAGEPAQPSGTTGAAPGGPAAAGTAGSTDLTTPPARRPLNDADLERRVRDLVAARAAAWNAGDSAALAAVMVPDSPAYLRDRADLERAEQQGFSYRGMNFEVRSVRPVEQPEGTERGSLRVEVEIQIDPYHVDQDRVAAVPVPGSVVSAAVELRVADSADAATTGVGTGHEVDPGDTSDAAAWRIWDWQ